MNTDSALSRSNKLVDNKGYVEYRTNKSLQMIRKSSSGANRTAFIHQSWDDFKRNTSSLEGVLKMNTNDIRNAIQKEMARVDRMSPWKKSAEEELKKQVSTMLALDRVNEQSIVEVIRKRLNNISNTLYKVDQGPDKKVIPPKAGDRGARIRMISDYVSALEEYSRAIGGSISGTSAQMVFEGNPKTATAFRKLDAIARQIKVDGGQSLIKSGEIPDPGDGKPIKIDDFNVWSMQTRTNLLIGEFYEQEIAQRLYQSFEKFQNGDFDPETVKVVGQGGGKSDISISTAIESMMGGLYDHLKKTGSGPNKTARDLNIGITIKSAKESTSGTYVNTGSLNTFPDISNGMSHIEKNIVFYALANSISHDVGFHHLEYFQDQELQIYNRYLDRLVLGDFSKIMFDLDSATPASLLITRENVYTSRDISRMLYAQFNSVNGQLETAATDKYLTQSLKSAFAIEISSNKQTMPSSFTHDSHQELMRRLRSTKIALRFRIGKGFSMHSMSALK